MSRPSESVPNGANTVGGRRRIAKSESMLGSYGTRTGAARAASTQLATRKSPHIAGRFLSRRRHVSCKRSVMADSGIDSRIQEVGHKIDQHKECGDEERGALDNRVVACLDGLVDPSPDAGP